MLDKYDTLLIRTAKANLSPKETVRRMVKIWRIRCMLPDNYNERHIHNVLASHMWEIIEKLELTSISKVIHRLFNPYDEYNYPVEERLKFIFGEAETILSLTEVKKLDGFITPAWWRNGGFEKRKEILKEREKKNETQSFINDVLR